jgi:hypothetical protein
MKFDLNGYIPTLSTKATLISKCKAIKRNKSVKGKERKDNNDDNNNNNNNNNNKKASSGNFDVRAKKDDRPQKVFFCLQELRGQPHT